MGILFSKNSDERTLLFRGIVLLGWYIAVVLVSDFLLIGIVGAYNGLLYALGGGTDLEYAFRAGYSARVRFFREYGDYVLYGQIATFLILAVFGRLPLTTKSD